MGRPPLRFCVNGHDTWECGRRPSDYRCVSCHRDSANRWKRNRRSEHLPLEAARAGLRARPPTLPWEPLRSLLEGRGLLGRVGPASKSEWSRWGIPPETADALSCRLLDRHPSEIYGDAWWAI